MGKKLNQQQNLILIEQLKEQVNNLMAVMQRLTSSASGQNKEYIAIGNQSLYRLLRLIRHMELSERMKDSENPIPVRKIVLDVTALCRELSRQVAPLAKEAQVEFHYEEEQKSLLMQADSALLNEMLFNLISNALRAAGKGGQAGLRVSENRDRIALTVWDSGPDGASSGQAGEEKPLPDLQSSLGLGVKIATYIAELHGGALVFEHQEEKGLRAIVSLPAQTGEWFFLRTPKPKYDTTGGFSPVLVELSDVLPYRAFLPDRVE